MLGILTTLLGILLTLLGLVVAWLVYELKRQEFRLGLLQRRAGAYESFKKVLSVYNRYDDFPMLDESKDDEYHKPLLLASQLGHEFKMESLLFDSNVEKISERLWDFIFLVRDIEEKRRTTDGEEWQEWVEKSQEIYPVYKQLWDDAENAITPYLRIREPKSLLQVLSSMFGNGRWLVALFGVLAVLLIWFFTTQIKCY